MIIQQFRAKNDPNGNPRRVWVAYSMATGEPVMIEDEGYKGYPADRFGPRQSHVEISSVPTTYAEYRDWLAVGRRLEAQRAEMEA